MNTRTENNVRILDLSDGTFMVMVRDRTVADRCPSREIAEGIANPYRYRNLSHWSRFPT